MLEAVLYPQGGEDFSRPPCFRSYNQPPCIRGGVPVTKRRGSGEKCGVTPGAACRLKPERSPRNGAEGGHSLWSCPEAKKSMKAAAKALLDMPVTSKELQQKMKLLGVPEGDSTYQMAVMVTMLNQAMKGTSRPPISCVILLGKARATKSGARS